MKVRAALRLAVACLAMICLLMSCRTSPEKAAGRTFRAGAYAMDVTPTGFPVIVNGGFLSKTADRAYDRLHVRWLVLDDGATRVALGLSDVYSIEFWFWSGVPNVWRGVTGILFSRGTTCWRWAARTARPGG